MKKKLVLLLLIPLFLLFVNSCSSIESWIRSSLEEKPIWVYEPQVSRDQIAFVGTGEAINETLATLRAYESILEQISFYIGKDVSNEYITELSERGGIEQYQLKITRNFTRKEENGVLVHLLAVAVKKVVDNDRSELSLEIEKKSNEIKELQSNAAFLLRQDEDIEAATQYLKIAKLANSIVNESGPQYYKDAQKRFFSIIEKITITFIEDESDSSSYYFMSKRGTRSLSTKIAKVPLKVSFTAENAREEEYVDDKTIYTNKSGRAVFINTNPSMMSSGELQIQFDTSPFIPYLGDLSEEDKERINTIVLNSTIRVPYNRPISIDTQNVLLSIGEYSLKGELLKSSYIEDIVSNSLKKRGIESTRITPSVEDDEEFLLTLSSEYDTATLFFGKSGVSSINQIKDGYAVIVLGEISLYELPNLTSDKTTHEIRAVGRGKSLEEAIDQAFMQGGAISASLLNRLLYSSP